MNPKPQTLNLPPGAPGRGAAAAGAGPLKGVHARQRRGRGRKGREDGARVASCSRFGALGEVARAFLLPARAQACGPLPLRPSPAWPDRIATHPPSTGEEGGAVWLGQLQHQGALQRIHQAGRQDRGEGPGGLGRWGVRISSSMDHAPLEYTHLQTHTHTHTHTQTHTHTPPPRWTRRSTAASRRSAPSWRGSGTRWNTERRPRWGRPLRRVWRRRGVWRWGVGGGLGRSRGRAGAQASHTVTPSSKHAA